MRGFSVRLVGMCLILQATSHWNDRPQESLSWAKPRALKLCGRMASSLSLAQVQCRMHSHVIVCCDSLIATHSGYKMEDHRTLRGLNTDRAHCLDALTRSERRRYIRAAMSFSFSIGDFIAVGDLAYRLYRDVYEVARAAPAEVRELERELERESSMLSQALQRYS